MFSETELEQALSPVRKYHTARNATPNTVLAAHLRSLGVQPVGPRWHAAKEYLERGHSFSEAAQAALAEDPTSPSGRRREHAVAEVPDADARSLSEAAALGGPPVAIADVGQVDGTARQPHTAGIAANGLRPPEAGTPSESLPRRHGPKAVPPGDWGMTWFPKVFGPGDIDGKGASKLLGTPNVPLSTVLVRETAQNSWDARLGHRTVTFAMHLRTLSDLERETLKERVFTGKATGLRLRQVLDRSSVRVLEVADRGTKGLGGPVRNDVQPPMGTPTNYIDLVLNVGAPRDVHLGAGTYGFGKTISYRVSGAGTVLIWSRSREDGTVQDRLIGSAIGDSFAMDNTRYTGRHWWGAVRDERRVEPWTDNDAATIAESVFDSSYSPDETGTTLMIIDPLLGGDDEGDDVQRLREAIMWNLWPKLLPTADGQRPMNIELYADGRPVDLGAVSDHPILTGYAEALQMVRSAQDGTSYAPRYNTKVHEVWSHRPKVLIGHLAFCRYPMPSPPHEPKVDRDTVPITAPSSHVAWMRHDAELVVRYDTRPRLDSDTLQWAAVFKPRADNDDAFAAAEPPAHDDWVPASIDDKAQRSLVNVGIRRTQEIVAGEIAPPTVPASEQDGRKSVAALADSLSKLVGAAHGSRPQRKSSNRSASAARSSRPQAEILRTYRGQVEDGYRIVALLVGVRNSGGRPVRVEADAGVATDGSRMHDQDLVSVLGWAASATGDVSSQEPDFGPIDHHWLVLRAAAGVGVDVSLSCVVRESERDG